MEESYDFSSSHPCSFDRVGFDLFPSPLLGLLWHSNPEEVGPPKRKRTSIKPGEKDLSSVHDDRLCLWISASLPFSIHLHGRSSEPSLRGRHVCRRDTECQWLGI